MPGRHARALWRPMTADEARMIRAFAACRFPPATSAKRFARDLLHQVELAEPKITDKQLGALRRLITRFRRQINPTALPAAEQHLLAKPAPPPPETDEGPLP